MISSPRVTFSFEDAFSVSRVQRALCARPTMPHRQKLLLRLRRVLVIKSHCDFWPRKVAQLEDRYLKVIAWTRGCIRGENVEQLVLARVAPSLSLAFAQHPIARAQIKF